MSKVPHDGCVVFTNELCDLSVAEASIAQVFGTEYPVFIRRIPASRPNQIYAVQVDGIHAEPVAAAVVEGFDPVSGVEQQRNSTG